MTPKTEIRESEWMALLDDEIQRCQQRPPNSKTSRELAEQWCLGLRRAQAIIYERMRQGRLVKIKSGKMTYYTKPC